MKKANIFKFLFRFRKKYHSLNKVTLSQKSLIKNHKNLQSINQNIKVCPVIKGNAYGHGLKLLAPVFDKLNTPFLIVDSLYEAYELYKIKSKTPILIMGYTDPSNFSVKPLDFHLCVFDLQTARSLNKYQPGCKIHIFVDTGMNREGVRLEDFLSFMRQIKKLKNLKVVGLCSHFADIDNKKSQKFTRKQIKKYKKALAIMQSLGINPKWRHISASGGIGKVEDDTFNMIRAGKAHYGVYPKGIDKKTQKKLSLTPVLEFSTTLALIKKTKKGEYVGYDLSFRAAKDTTIGVLPAGYYEGVDRRLSNKGFVKIRNTFCPIIGRVSMNMTTVDISKVKNPKIGERVVIYSANPKDKNSITNSAKVAKTIEYEIIAKISSTARRELV